MSEYASVRYFPYKLDPKTFGIKSLSAKLDA